MLTLVVGALLMVATIRQLARVDVGFDADGLYTFAIRPGSVGYSPARTVAYREEFERRLARVPGVERVAAAVRLPFAGTTMTTLVKVPGGQNVDTQATEIFSSTYFETLRIPLRRGRLFTQDDLGTGGAQARPVVVISNLLARRLFGTGDAVGRTIEFGTRGRGGRPFEVIGVVGDVRNGSLTEDAEPMIYEPAALAVPVRPDAMFAVRVRDGVDVAAAAQSIAADLDPALPLWFPMSMEEAVARARAEWDILAQLMTALAAVAVILASVGLYGVVAFGVAARRREFGIRLALGAPPASVMALVFRRTASMVVAGLILGASGAIVIARTLSAKLFGVAPFDPLVWTMAALALVVLAGIASWIPARRAVSADVTGALRAL